MRRPVFRFLAITLGITAMYMALDRLWLALTPMLARTFNAGQERKWNDEAAGVARSSRDAERRLPASARVIAYRLGVEVGYCSNVLGSFAMSSPEIQAQARDAMEPRLSSARDLAHALGLEELPLVPVATVEQFGRISERIDADETGLATRLEAVTSPRHRHLFLLGMHVGVSAALADVMQGQMFSPVRTNIGRHATLAGVPAVSWEPVARAPEGATPQDRTAAYRAALAVLEKAVSQLEASP